MSDRKKDEKKKKKKSIWEGEILRIIEKSLKAAMD